MQQPLFFVGFYIFQVKKKLFLLSLDFYIISYDLLWWYSNIDVSKFPFFLNSKIWTMLTCFLFVFVALLKENRFKHNSGDSIESSKRFRLSKGKRHRSGEMSDPPKTVLYPPLPNPDEKSSQQKVTASDEISPKRKYLAVGVLFLINLLNYMDRFTIAGKKHINFFVHFNSHALLFLLIMIFCTNVNLKW